MATAILDLATNSISKEAFAQQIKACIIHYPNVNNLLADHFADISKMVTLGSRARDYRIY